MPSSVQFNGKTYFRPNAYVSTDASSLDSPSIDASGIVLIIGQAVGGAPYTAIQSRSDIKGYSSVQSLARDIPAGDLLDAANIAFNASNDPAINGGAQTVIALKANPASQASLTLNSSTKPSITFTANQWGTAGNMVSVAIGAGTSKGVSCTIVQGTISEFSDNLGGAQVATLAYQKGSGSWGTMQGSVAAGALLATGTLATSGLASDITKSALTAASLITILADPSDAGKQLTVVGLSAAGTSLMETVSLAGGTQSTVNTYSRLLGLSLSAPALSVKLSDGAAATLATLTSNGTSLGLQARSGVYVANSTISVTGDQAGNQAVLIGVNASGGVISEAINTTTGTVTTTQSFMRLTSIALGGMAAARSITLTAQALNIPAASGQMLSGLLGAVNALAVSSAANAIGFKLAVINNQGTTLSTELDSLAATDITAGGATLTASLEGLIDWVNANSQLVTALPATGAVALPLVTAATFLTGGSEATASPADYQACLNISRQVRVNLVVCCTSDPAVRAMTDAHATFMSGAGMSERFAEVSVMDPTLTKPATLTQFLAARAQLNSAVSQLTSNPLSAYDTTGTYRTFPPWMTSVYLAGMRAGAGPGISLTNKRVGALAVSQDPSWNPMDNGEQLMAAGCTILENVDGFGIIVTRDLTTYTADSNPVNSEASVRYAAQFATYYFRTALRQAVGKPGFSGTAASVQSAAVNLLSFMQNTGIITASKGLSITISGDKMLVAVGLAPVLPVNFVVATLSFYNVPQTLNS